MNENEIKFNKYTIKKFNLEKNENTDNDQKEKRNNAVNIETEFYVNNDNKFQYCVVLTVDIKTKEENILIVMDGYFEFSQNFDNELIEQFLKITAPTILYPYCRSFISTISSFDSQQAIILPVINFANMKNNNQ